MKKQENKNNLPIIFWIIIATLSVVVPWVLVVNLESPDRDTSLKSLNTLFAGLAFIALISTLIYQRKEFKINSKAQDTQTKINTLLALCTEYKEREKELQDLLNKSKKVKGAKYIKELEMVLDEVSSVSIYYFRKLQKELKVLNLKTHPELRLLRKKVEAEGNLDNLINIIGLVDNEDEIIRLTKFERSKLTGNDIFIENAERVKREIAEKQQKTTPSPDALNKPHED